MSIGRKLTRDRDADGKLDQWAISWKSWFAWKSWFFNHGGSFTAPDNPADITFGDSGTVESLQWMQDLLFKTQIVAQTQQIPGDARKAYLEGQVAMTQVGAGFLDTANQAFFQKAVVLEPKGPGGRSVMTTYWAWMISSHSKNPDLAWELVKCLTDYEMYAAEVKSGNNAFQRRAMQSFFGLSTNVKGYRETFLEYFNNPIFLAAPIMAPAAHDGIVRVVETVVLRNVKSARIAVEEAVESIRKQSRDFWSKYEVQR